MLGAEIMPPLFFYLGIILRSLLERSEEEIAMKTLNVRKAENGNLELRSIESITTELATVSWLKCQLRDVYYPIHNASIANLSVVAVPSKCPAG